MKTLFRFTITKITI